VNAQRVQDIIREHTDAFLVQMLGEEASGLGEERIKYLKSNGVLLPTEYVRVNGQDPLAVVQLLGTHLGDVLPGDQRYRDTLAELEKTAPWMHPLSPVQYPVAFEEGMSPADGGTAGLVAQALAQEERRSLSPTRNAERVFLSASPPGVVNVYDWEEAANSMGSLIRGLGNAWSELLQDTVGEQWEGERVVSVPDPEARENTLEKVRAVLSRAKKEGTPVQQVARQLAAATKDFARNWRRIAETEMQGLYNQAAARLAVHRYGKDAQVIRMPEKGACSACLRVFMRGGEPITWSVQELMQNGTNAGLPRSQWKATLWPVHPRCRCGTIVVSPFMEYRDGRLRAKRPT